MTAKIFTFPRTSQHMTLDEIFAELEIPHDPLPRQGDVDHWANYREKRAILNRAAFRAV